MLLDSLLRLARADSGTETSRPRRIDLGLSLRRACDQIAFLAKKKGLALQSNLPSKTVFLFVDPDHLARLWLILLDNAVKYTPRGGRVEMAIRTADRDWAAVEVRDTGAGIAETDLPHIFERFFRADKVRGRQDGAGLGLALAKWIVDAHQASVAVTSTVGSGSTFRVVFPWKEFRALDETTAAPESWVVLSANLDHSA